MIRPARHRACPASCDADRPAPDNPGGPPCCPVALAAVGLPDQDAYRAARGRGVRVSDHTAVGQRDPEAVAGWPGGPPERVPVANLAPMDLELFEGLPPRAGLHLDED